MSENRMMDACVYKGNHIFEIEKWERPVPGPGEVLVEVKSVGICGSDVLGYLGRTQNRGPGLVFGHEAAGIIAELGENVYNWHIGDRVALSPFIVCGKCDSCRRGFSMLCDQGKTLGSSRQGMQQGALREYMVMPAENHLFQLEDNVSFDEGALADPLGNCLHVMNRAGVSPGGTVAIIGVGSIGLIAIQVAKLRGPLQVIAVDTVPERLRWAKEMGADAVVNAREEDTVEAIKRLTGGKGADVVMNAAGNDISYKNAVFAARKRGVVAAFGYNDPNACLQIPSEAFIFKELTMLGNGGMDGFEIRTMLDLLAAGRISVEKVITHRFGLDNVTEAFQLLTEKPEEAVKVMIQLR